MELTFWVGREIRNKIKIGKHGDVSVKQEEQTGKVSGGVQILDGKARQPLRRQRLMKAERVRRPQGQVGGENSKNRTYTGAKVGHPSWCGEKRGREERAEGKRMGGEAGRSPVGRVRTLAPSQRDTENLFEAGK